jgi:hypothetical protein
MADFIRAFFRRSDPVAAVEQLTAALVEAILDWTSRNRPSGRVCGHNSDGITQQ